MGFFEQHPVILIPLVILIVEGWGALKARIVTPLIRSKRIH